MRLCVVCVLSVHVCVCGGGVASRVQVRSSSKCMGCAQPARQVLERMHASTRRPNNAGVPSSSSCSRKHARSCHYKGAVKFKQRVGSQCVASRARSRDLPAARPLPTCTGPTRAGGCPGVECVGVYGVTWLDCLCAGLCRLITAPLQNVVIHNNNNILDFF